jgi:hypothetical protein
MHSCALHQPEYEFSFPKYPRVHLPVVIASEVLLIHRRSGQCQLSCLFEKIDIIFSGLFDLIFCL